MAKSMWRLIPGERRDGEDEKRGKGRSAHSYF